MNNAYKTSNNNGLLKSLDPHKKHSTDNSLVGVQKPQKWVYGNKIVQGKKELHGKKSSLKV